MAKYLTLHLFCSVVLSQNIDLNPIIAGIKYYDSQLIRCLNGKDLVVSSVILPRQAQTEVGLYKARNDQMREKEACFDLCAI
jgi:hypothetical protein